VVSIQDLRPNSQDTSAFYLANIYQLLANPNVSRESIFATPTQPLTLVSSVWSSVSHVPYWPHCYNSGRVDMLRSLNRHGIVHTSEHRFVHSFPVAWKGFIFLGRLRRCPLYYTCPCPCPSRDWLSFCSTSTIPCSAWLPGGWDLQGRYKVATRSCQCSGTIVPTMHRFLRRPGSSVLPSNMYSFAGYFGAAPSSVSHSLIG
jgi:hypothetical protein